MVRGLMRGSILGLIGVVLAIVVASVLAIAVLRSGDTLILDLEPGDCFDLPADAGDPTIEAVATVACDEPHEAEVVAVGLLNDDRDRPYPTDEALLAEVDTRCSMAFEGRPDAAAIAADFGLLPVAPNEQSWSVFEGRYVCVAIPYGGGTTTSAITAEP